MRAIASFKLDSFTPDPPYREDDGVKHGRIRIEKTFQGEVEGRGFVEMLANQNEGGAGYVALERIVGSVHGRSGGFSLLHIGTAVGDKTWARWPVIPGSGTGELKTIRGNGQIDIDADGHHTLTLEYELD
ncbi:MAG: DUF3224 domain-containing protein [Candidatus Dormibacteraeota bacterium]|nr:DUF3224 domain-containing protein [Candidatus Dormibacteraeota bacterium]